MQLIRDILIPFCLLHSHTTIKSQGIFYPVSTHHLTAAQFAPEVTDAFIAAVNPAMAAYVTNFSACLYTEKRFMSAELMLIKVAAAFKFSGSGLALQLQHFGTSIYNEKVAGISYGKTLGKLSIGAGFNYHMVHIPDNGIRLLGASIASIWKVSEKVYAFCMLSNPPLFRAKHYEKSFRLSSEFRAGMGYLTAENLYLGIESKKDEGRTAQLIASLRYQFAQDKFIRCSWTTGNNQPFINLGWSKKVLRFEAGFHYHPSLGISPDFILIYHVPSTKES